MALIFIQSSQPGLVEDLGIWTVILSNVGHAVMFGSMAALLWWALRPVTDLALPIAVGVALLYGISDEVHQAFVAARTASIADFGLDALGISVAALLIRSPRSGGTDSERGAGTGPEVRGARGGASVETGTSA
jgi:VanZ family protein